jgi:hypothetical protein
MVDGGSPGTTLFRLEEDFYAQEIDLSRATDDRCARRNSDEQGQRRCIGTWDRRGGSRRSDARHSHRVGLWSLSMPLEAALARPSPCLGSLGPAPLSRMLLREAAACLGRSLRRPWLVHSLEPGQAAGNDALRAGLFSRRHETLQCRAASHVRLSSSSPHQLPKWKSWNARS